MKVGIVNLNSGNLFSIKKTIKNLGHDPHVCVDSNDLYSCDKIILPGVGSFNSAINLLKKFNYISILNDLVLKKGIHLLGICLGMQLICKSSTENGFNQGLSFIDLPVDSLETLGCELSVPHIGWNNIIINKDISILNEIPNNSDFYFVHNFAVKYKDSPYIIAKTSYQINFASILNKDNIYAVQFHPEKSSASGTRLLRNFLNL